MWWWHGNWGWGGWLIMTIGMLAFWGLVIWAVVRLVRTTTTQRETGGDAETILAKRFAAGEIDEDEYQRRLDTLSATRGTAHTPANRDVGPQ